MSLSHSPHQEERSQPPQGYEALASRFLAMMQEYADVFWWLAPDGWMQEVSSSWHTFTGQQERECLGRGWLDAVHPADQRQFENTLHHTLTSGQIAEMECHLRRDDGTYRLIRLRVIPVRLPDGTPGEVLVCGTDRTRQELAGKMRDAQRQLAEKASGVGMWDWDLRTDQVV